MYRLCKKFHFEAAHSLPLLPEGHKCRRKHGHSYRVQLVLKVEQLDSRGFAAVDYDDLDAFGLYLNDRFDHQCLNDLSEFLAMPTTAENLARHFYGWAKARWPQLEKVRVSETRRTWVEYSE